MGVKAILSASEVDGVPCVTLTRMWPWMTTLKVRHRERRPRFDPEYGHGSFRFGHEAS